jgi:uncharacterized protein (DUF2384 family)
LIGLVNQLHFKKILRVGCISAKPALHDRYNWICRMATKMLDPVLSQLCGGSVQGIDPKLLAKLLQMTLGELAALCGLHRVTLSRSPASPEVQVKLGSIATILARAADMAGCLNKAVVWFRYQSIPALGNKSARQAVQNGKADLVLEWLDALEDGAYG